MLHLPRSLHMEVHTVLCLPRNLRMEVHKVLRLARNLHMEVHTVLCLPQNLRMEVHKVLRLPLNLRMEVHKVLRLPRNPRMEVHKVLRLPRKLRRCPADARRRQGVHPTPWQAAKYCACHAICARAQPTPDDARAYIRPLGAQQSAAPATKSAPVPSRRQTTPGRTSDPVASSKVLCLPRNLRRCPADARRRQGCLLYTSPSPRDA